MSHYMHVFVSSNLEVEDFKKELESLLEIKLEARSGDHGKWYLGRSSGVWMEVYRHRFESGDDFPLGQYPYVIRLEGTVAHWEEREKRLYEYARSVFGRLKSLNKYSLLLLDELGPQLDEFTPGVSG